MGFVSSNPERNQFYAVKTLNKISPLPFSGLKIKSVKAANCKKALNNNKETIKRLSINGKNIRQNFFLMAYCKPYCKGESKTNMQM